MRTGKVLWVAVLSTVCGFSIPVGAQVLPIETTIIDERPVVLVPFGGAELSGSAMAGGVSIRVSTDDGLRTYRAFYQGRIYTAYEDASRPATRLAFDPTARRFRAISPTIRVELHDYDSLDSLVRDQGALYGKAYPELGFALIRLGPDADPARVVELLNVDTRVREARLHFERAPKRPTIAPILRDWRSGSPNRPSAKTGTTDSLSADLFILPKIDIQGSQFALNVTVLNAGAGSSERSTLRAQLVSIVADDSTMDEDDATTSVITTADARIPALDGKGTPHTVAVLFDTSELDAGETYYVLLSILDGTLFLDDAETLARSYSGFTLDSLLRVQHVCVEPGRGSSGGTADPLLAQQWYLDNTGQTAYAAEWRRERGGPADGRCPHGRSDRGGRAGGRGRYRP